MLQCLYQKLSGATQSGATRCCIVSIISDDLLRPVQLFYDCILSYPKYFALQALLYIRLKPIPTFGSNFRRTSYQRRPVHQRLKYLENDIFKKVIWCFCVKKPQCSKGIKGCISNILISTISFKLDTWHNTERSNI